MKTLLKTFIIALVAFSISPAYAQDKTIDSVNLASGRIVHVTIDQAGTTLKDVSVTEPAGVVAEVLDVANRTATLRQLIEGSEVLITIQFSEGFKTFHKFQTTAGGESAGGAAEVEPAGIKSVNPASGISLYVVLGDDNVTMTNINCKKGMTAKITDAENHIATLAQSGVTIYIKFSDDFSTFSKYDIIAAQKKATQESETLENVKAAEEEAKAAALDAKNAADDATKATEVTKATEFAKKANEAAKKAADAAKKAADAAKDGKDNAEIKKYTMKATKDADLARISAELAEQKVVDLKGKTKSDAEAAKKTTDNVKKLAKTAKDAANEAKKYATDTKNTNDVATADAAAAMADAAATQAETAATQAETAAKDGNEEAKKYAAAARTDAQAARTDAVAAKKDATEKANIKINTQNDSIKPAGKRDLGL